MQEENLSEDKEIDQLYEAILKKMEKLYPGMRERAKRIQEMTPEEQLKERDVYSESEAFWADNEEEYLKSGKKAWTFYQEKMAEQENQKT